VDAARCNSGPFLINFMVEKEDAVYPMVGPGAALDEMIRRPSNEPIPLIETSEEP
jgi:acetolactate synthase-1/2/3 large subunit